MDGNHPNRKKDKLNPYTLSIENDIYWMTGKKNSRRSWQKPRKSRNLTSNNFETLCPEGPALAQRLWWYISPVAACFLVQPGVGRQGCSAPPFSAARP